jgi:hypothetical protein
MPIALPQLSADIRDLFAGRRDLLHCPVARNRSIDDGSPELDQGGRLPQKTAAASRAPPAPSQPWQIPRGNLTAWPAANLPPDKSGAMMDKRPL